MKKIYITPKMECNDWEIKETILAASMPGVNDDVSSDVNQPNLSNKEVWEDGLW